MKKLILLFLLFSTVSRADQVCQGLFPSLNSSTEIRDYISTRFYSFKTLLMTTGYIHPTIEPIVVWVERFRVTSLGIPKPYVQSTVRPFYITEGRKQIPLSVPHYRAELIRPQVEEIQRSEIQLFLKLRDDFERQASGIFWGVDPVVSEDPIYSREIRYKDAPANYGHTNGRPGPAEYDGWQIRSPRTWYYYHSMYAHDLLDDKPKKSKPFRITQKDLNHVLSLKELKEGHGNGWDPQSLPAIARDISWHDQICQDPLVQKAISDSEQSQPVPAELSSISKVLFEDSENIIIEVSVDPRKSTKLMEMFHFLNWQLAQRNYRNSGIVPHNLITALALAALAQKREEYQQILFYNKRVWNAFLSLLNSHKDDQAKAFQPFFPEFGLSLYPSVHDRIARSTYQEISRFFHNTSPDPLGLLKGLQRSRRSNYRFLHTAISQIPEDETVRAEALSQEHIRMYQERFGLKPWDVINEGIWGHMADLRAPRDEVLQNISRLLGAGG